MKLAAADTQRSCTQHMPQAEGFADVFPLPLVPFEQFMLLDDRVDYPMMCDLQLVFRGQIDRPAFKSALQAALARNPLLTALVEPVGSGRHTWVATDRRPEIDWASADEPIAGSYGTYVDLRTEIGLKLWVRQGPDTATLLLHFHHACCDALGAFQFIEDLLAAYAGAMSDGGSEPTPRELEPRRLLSRGTFETGPASFGARLSQAGMGLVEGFKFFVPPPVPLAKPDCTNADASSDAGVFFVNHSCDETLARGLRQVASQNGATLNDLLLRDFFLTLRDWNAQAGHDPKRRRLRVLMPSNLRRREDRAMPAANVMSFAFLTRRANACDRPQELLESIREETEAIRRHQLARMFLDVISMGSAVLPLLTGRKQCLATAILTNIGDPTRRFATRFPRHDGLIVAGNLVLEEISGVPPLRPMTRTVMAIYTYAGKLTISSRCDRHLYSRDDTRSLLAAFVERLKGSVSS